MASSSREPAQEGISSPESPSFDAEARFFALAAPFTERFDYRISWVADAAIVEVGGELDIATAPALEHAIASIEEPPPRVVVDLSHVSFLDSAALKALSHSERRLSKQDVALRVVLPLDQAIGKLFEITQLTERLGVVASLDHALENE